MPISDPPPADLIPAAQAGPRKAQDGGMRRLMQDLMIMTNSFSFVLADTDPAEVDVERHRDGIADIISRLEEHHPFPGPGFGAGRMTGRRQRRTRTRYSTSWRWSA
jgi:hypothetical protein